MTQPPSEAPEKKPEPKGRPRAGLRDMLLSMIVLAVIVLALAALTHSCSFNPGGPSTSGGVVPTFDVSDELANDVTQVHFPLKQLTLPSGWHANSGGMTTVGPHGQDSAVKVGYLTPRNRFLAFVQSNDSAADLAAVEASITNGAQLPSRGTVEVSGTRWTVYPGVRDELSWVTDLGQVRLLITGNGDDGEFRTMAEAALNAKPVSAPRP